MVMLNAQNAQSEDDIGGRGRPSPGRYHVAIQHAEEKGSKKKGTPGLEVEFQVICEGVGLDNKTPTSGQAGKVMPLFLSYISEKSEEATKTCLDRVARLALCCGVLAPGEAKEVNWSDAVGKELVIEIEAGEKYTDSNGNEKPGNSQVAFLGFWSLGNKAVANVPRDATSPGMQAIAGRLRAGAGTDAPAAPKTANGNGGNGNGNGAKAGTATAPAQHATTGTATAGKRSWKDL